MDFYIFFQIGTDGNENEMQWLTEITPPFIDLPPQMDKRTIYFIKNCNFQATKRVIAYDSPVQLCGTWSFCRKRYK